MKIHETHYIRGATQNPYEHPKHKETYIYLPNKNINNSKT